MDGSDNQLFFLTAEAQRQFGNLLLKWTRLPETRPGDRQDAHLSVVERGDFVAFLRSEGLFSPKDYLLRDGVDFVHIVTRQPENLTLLLPERHIVNSVEKQPKVRVHLSRTERNAEEKYKATITNKQVPAPQDPKNSAMVGAEIDKSAYKEFLADYLSDACIKQCL